MQGKRELRTESNIDSRCIQEFPLFLDAGHLATFFSIAIWIVWAAPLFGCTGQERDRQWVVGDSLLFHWMECFRGALDGS